MLYRAAPKENHREYMERRAKHSLGPCRFCGENESFLYQEEDLPNWNFEMHKFVPLTEPQAARLFLLGCRVILHEDWTSDERR